MHKGGSLETMLQAHSNKENCHTPCWKQNGWKSNIIFIEIGLTTEKTLNFFGPNMKIMGQGKRGKRMTSYSIINVSVRRMKNRMQNIPEQNYKRKNSGRVQVYIS